MKDRREAEKYRGQRKYEFEKSHVGVNVGRRDLPIESPSVCQAKAPDIQDSFFLPFSHGCALPELVPDFDLHLFLLGPLYLHR